MAPNSFGASVAWVCLLRAAKSLPNYRGLFEALAQALGSSVYCDYDTLSSQLSGEGDESDAWLMFEAETHFGRSRVMEKEAYRLQRALDLVMESIRNAKSELENRSMFSALGVVSDLLRDASNQAVQALEKQKRRVESETERKQKVMSPEEEEDDEDDEEENKENKENKRELKEVVTDSEMVMHYFNELDNNNLHHFMSDIAKHRKNFVSASLLSDLFGTASSTSRLTFLSILWRLLNHKEKNSFLSTVPVRQRDSGLREQLESLLQSSGVPRGERKKKEKTREEGNGDDVEEDDDDDDVEEESSTMPYADTVLLHWVEYACQAAKSAADSESQIFLHQMMCALEMIPVGEQQISKNLQVPVGAMSLLECQAREIVRQLHVERSKGATLQVQVQELREELIETKASVRTMASVQAKLNEYANTDIRSDDHGVEVSVDYVQGGDASSRDGGGHASKTVQWPILHHTSNPRRHSLHRMIDDFFEEETLRNGGRAYVGAGANNNNNNAVTGISDVVPLEEMYASMTSCYDCALLADVNYPMATIVKLQLVSECGDPHLAIEHCKRFDHALRARYKTDQRCHLFAMLCGSIQGSSFLSRAETNQFVVTTLAHMMKEGVVDGATSIHDIFETMADGKRARLFHYDRAETVVRNLFRVRNDKGNEVGSDEKVRSDFLNIEIIFCAWPVAHVVCVFCVVFLCVCCVLCVCLHVFFVCVCCIFQSSNSTGQRWVQVGRCFHK